MLSRYDQYADRSAYDVFQRTRSQHHERPFIHVPAGCAGGPVELTYEQAGTAAERLAASYRAAGYGRGHHVALLLDSHAEFFLHWLALSSIGATIVPLGADLTAEDANYVLQHGDVDLLVHLPARESAARHAASQIDRLPLTTSPAVEAQEVPLASRPTILTMRMEERPPRKEPNRGQH